MSISTIVKHSSAAGLALAISMQVSGATRESFADQPLGSIAPITLTHSNISRGNAKAYRTWFENGSWQGDLAEYSVSSTGTITSSVNYSGVSPANPGDDPANWSAHVVFADAEADDEDYWDTGRKIITWDGNSQVPFRWGVDVIGTINMALIDFAALAAGDDSSIVLDFIRGDRSNEYPAEAGLRARVSVLGDIIHSRPLYVSAPNDGHTENEYATWAASKTEREARVYVGANDGMLHVFDAADGSEVYAYIPSMVIGKPTAPAAVQLSKLASRPHQHTYFVDGQLTTRDVYYDDNWHTVLVGTLGAGGKGLFALDITDPDLDSEDSSTGTNAKALWEVNAWSDDDLGDSFSRPVIAKLNDGNWYAVVGNGYNSVNGIAQLYIINIKTGDVFKRLSTRSGSAEEPNGLSSPTLLDSNRDGMVDYAYAGDIDGNLWKFDLTSDTPGEWGEAYEKPLFDGSPTQPIIVAPKIARHTGDGYVLYFATGRLYTTDDGDDDSVQAMYGIRDDYFLYASPADGEEVEDRSSPPDADDLSLLAQTWDGPKAFTYTSESVDYEESIAIYNPDPGYVDWSTQHGWQIEFPAGMRVLQPVQLRDFRVKATVHNPVGRDNYLLEAAIYDGGPHPTPIYDLNNDGVLGTADLWDASGEDEEADWHVPMVWQQISSIMSEVTIARVVGGLDALFLNYLEPPLEEACEGDCEGGFQGGHIDVDTWHTDQAFAGESSKHDHEYDKKVGRVYVDFFDINIPLPAGAEAPRKEVKEHIEINSTGPDGDNPSSDIASDEKFIVLVANADFSPGSTLKIGAKEWNVMEYQREIHTALKNWDATDSDAVPEDSDGDSLIFTWGEIAALRDAEDRTIAHHFNDVAILRGGLHPTQTGCVNSSAYGAMDGNDPQTFDPDSLEGRWRNGALTTQLVKASHFSANPAIGQVDIQKPDDLSEVVTLEDGTQISTSVDYNDNGSIEEDNHEVMGGLIAKSGDEHIWESTLFWHFGNLSQIVLGTKPCYGQDGWEEAVAFEQSNDPITDALEYLDEESDLDLGSSIDEALAATEACSQLNCKTLYRNLEKLADLVDDYTLTGEGDDNSGLGGDGETPQNEGGEGGVIAPLPTEPNEFEDGRKSWSDIVN